MNSTILLEVAAAAGLLACLVVILASLRRGR
jgi:hypothetical protein